MANQLAIVYDYGNAGNLGSGINLTDMFQFNMDVQALIFTF